MEFGDTESCSVKIGDRTLGDAQAREICALKRRNITFTSDLSGVRSQLEGLRAQLRSIQPDSARLAMLRQQESELARTLSRYTMALTDDARRVYDVTSPRSGESFFSLRAEQGSIIGVSIDARPRDTDRWGAYVAGV